MASLCASRSGFAGAQRALAAQARRGRVAGLAGV